MSPLFKRPDRASRPPSWGQDWACPVRSKRLELGFPGGALHSCSESSAVEPGEGQMRNVGEAKGPNAVAGASSTTARGGVERNSFCSGMKGDDEMATERNAEPASTEGKHSAEHPGGKGKDWWGRLLAALAAAALTGGVTLSVHRNQIAARRVELVSARESAVQALQGRVFDTFATHVAPVVEDNDDRKVVLLSALHSNFNKFFDMRAVFETFASRTEDPTARHELMRLAKRVARRQAQHIKAHSGGSEKHGTMSETVERCWPAKSGEKKTTVTLGAHDVTVFIKSEPVRYCIPDELASTYEKVARYKDDDDEIIDDVVDQVGVTIILDKGEPADFTVSYMDSPYMDNFWMAHHDGTQGRLAVILKDIDTIVKEGCEDARAGDRPKLAYRIKLEVLHFPGSLFTPTERPPARAIESGVW